MGEAACRVLQEQVSIGDRVGNARESMRGALEFSPGAVARTDWFPKKNERTINDMTRIVTKAGRKMCEHIFNSAIDGGNFLAREEANKNALEAFAAEQLY